MLGCTICRDESTEDRVATQQWDGTRLNLPVSMEGKSLSLARLQVFFEELIEYLSRHKELVSEIQVERRVEATVAMCPAMAANIKAYKQLHLHDPQRNWQFFPSLIKTMISQRLETQIEKADYRSFATLPTTPFLRQGRKR